MSSLGPRATQEIEKLPIDRLRDGSMSDAEVIRLAAETIRHNAAMHDPARNLWNALGGRLELVRLADPMQKRKPWLYGGDRV